MGAARSSPPHPLSSWLKKQPTEKENIGSYKHLTCPQARCFFISKIGGHHGQISEKHRSCAAYQRDAVSSNLSPRRTGSQNGQGVLHQDAQQPCYHARKWAVSLVFAEQGWQQCTRLSGKGRGHGFCLSGTSVECNGSCACFYSDG